MKPRTLAALAMLFVGLGVLELARGQQQAPARSAPANPDRAARRVELARLRARVDLLAIEHKVDADLLEKMIHDVRNMDALEAMKQQIPTIVKGLGQVLGQKIEPKKLDGFEPSFAVDSATINLVRPLLALKREEFLRQSEELHTLRLELADLEAAYQATAR